MDFQEALLWTPQISLWLGLNRFKLHLSTKYVVEMDIYEIKIQSIPWDRGGSAVPKCAFSQFSEVKSLTRDKYAIKEFRLAVCF